MLRGRITLEPVEFIGRATEHHMVAAFVRAEFDTRPEYEEALRRLGAERDQLVDRPDLSDSSANKQRAFLLGAARGYPDGLLFYAWPREVEWWRTRTTPDEVSTFKVLADPPWLRLSRGTRLVGDAAANVGRAAAPQVLSEKITALAEQVRQGRVFDELILVGCQRKRPYVLVEGNSRATAYAFGGLPPVIECLLGVSAEMRSWGWWGDASGS